MHKPRMFCSALLTATLALLAGCASAPPMTGQGPPTPEAVQAPSAPAATPAPRAELPAPVATVERPAEPAPTDQELRQRPDPEPRVEPLRSGGPNKPYTVDGERHTPRLDDLPVHERGVASWYGKPFHGRKTASGETFDMYGLTAAHKTLPIPSYVRVRNPANGRELVLRVNDRGPFIPGRIVDLSYAAAVKLGVRGVAAVELTRLTHDDIHTGAWRRDAEAGASKSVTVAATLPAEAAPTTAPPPRPDNPAPTRPQPAHTSAARGFWLQLGAFAQGDGVASFRRQVERQVSWLAPLLTVFHDAGLHRLQAGPYPSRQDAQGAADRLRHALQLLPLVTERK